MQSRREWEQDDLFVAGPLRDLVPPDHVLRRIDAALDLSWIQDEVREAYCQDNGRPSIDPESALRLMLAGFVEGIVHDRALMRRAQTDLAFRWFMGYRLDEKLPDHSSLTRIRQRWGAERFKRILQRVVRECVAAGLVRGDTVHIDATLIRADVSWESLTTEHVGQVLKANTDKDDDDRPEPPYFPPGRPRKAPKPKKRSTTDPDASMATSNRDFHLQPSYRQHTAVDDHAGIIVDIAVETGQANEGQQLIEQIERVEANTGIAVEIVTADKGYAHASNYGLLDQRGMLAVIPPQKTLQRKRGNQRIPLGRFKYDARHQRVTCPTGKSLSRHKHDPHRGGTVFQASRRHCKACPLRQRCVPPSAIARSVLIPDRYDALLRYRRKILHGWDEAMRTQYVRHRWLVEGAHGRAKSQHGLSAARRGLDNVRIQAYLTAIVMNLKKLADQKAFTGPIRTLQRFITRLKRTLRAQPLSVA